jgi:hypothetical protein
MNRKLRLIAGILLFVAANTRAGDSRVLLLPKLRPGQVIHYLIRFRSAKVVRTESHVAAPMAPDSAQTDASSLLRIEILDAQKADGKPAIHALARFLSLDAGTGARQPAGENPDGNHQGANSAGPTIEFTISQDGSVKIIKGAGSLSPEQQQVWEEWVARFAAAWALPGVAAKIGEKWRSEQAVQSASPIAGLHWVRETEYVRNEPCRAS